MTNKEAKIETATERCQKIVDQTNALARLFYASHGYRAPAGYRFDQARHPQELGMWNLAVIAQQTLCDVDPQEALEELG